MTQKVLLFWLSEAYIDERTVSVVKQYGGGRRILFSTDIAEVLSVAEHIDIVLGRIPLNHLKDLPNLQWFQQFGTGVEWLREHPETVTAPFVLTNCSDGHCQVVADHFFALLLSIARDIPRSVRAQDKQQWDRPVIDSPSLFCLSGKTMLIVGLGSIGSEIIKRGTAFAMRVTGVRRDVNKTIPGLAALYSIDQLYQAASEADIVVACLPNTTHTDQLFDAGFFQSMKNSAYFFNVGRGTTVDEPALAQALQQQQISGAGLDVFDSEPLDASSILWQAPNLLITPHTGGHYRDVIATWRDVGLDNLQRYDQGLPLRNIVDKSIGY